MGGTGRVIEPARQGGLRGGWEWGLGFVKTI